MFVVDNASTDESVVMIREQFPLVNLIENSENIGFARANNLALRQSRGEYLMLLNPDTQLKAGALQTLVEFIANNPQAAAAGPRILNPDGSLQPSCSPTPTLLREMLRLLHAPGVRPDGYYPMHSWDQSTPRQVDTMLGACIVIKREALEQIGFLDEDYFIYSEEVDLCTRLKQAGWELYWVPQSEIVHYGGQSTQQVAQEMFFRLYEGKLIYFRKHRGKLAANLYKIILAVAALMRIASSPLALLRGPTVRQSQRIMVQNYSRLLLSLPEL